MAKYKHSSISFKKSPKHSTLFRAFGNKENGIISNLVNLGDQLSKH